MEKSSNNPHFEIITNKRKKCTRGNVHAFTKIACSKENVE
jgi:hypothetical protein